MDKKQTEDSIFDAYGYRYNVGIIIRGKPGEVFWGKRRGQQSWQFPQGGVIAGESAQEAMYRELFEETGLSADDVRLLGMTEGWLKYRLPARYRRRRKSGMLQCVGQRQRWFVLELCASENAINLAASGTPEFDDWRWIDFNQTPKEVVKFKQQVYVQAYQALAHLIYPTGQIPILQDSGENSSSKRTSKKVHFYHKKKTRKHSSPLG